MIKKFLFIIVLATAVFFRFSGIYPGYPPYHSDEGISYSSAVNMIKNKNFDPGRYDYPSLVPVINYLFYTQFFIPLSWTSFNISNFDNFLSGRIKFPFEIIAYNQIFQNKILGDREINALVWGRIVTAIFGVGVVFLTYKIGKRLSGFTLGIIASFLVSVNYREVLNSHLGLPDIYNAFFLLLSFYFSFNLLQKPKIINYFLTGISMGLSLGVKFQVFAFLPFVIVHFWKHLEHRNKIFNLNSLFNKNLSIALLTSIFVFILLNPYLLINHEIFLHQIKDVSLKYSAGKNSLDLFGLVYLYKVGIGPVASWLFIIGSVLLGFVNRKKFILLFSIIFPFFVVTNFMTIGGFYTRNYVTIIPFLLIVASFPFVYLFEKFKIKTTRIIIIFLVFGVLLLGIKDHVANSFVLVNAYKSTWNYKVAEIKTNKIIPQEETVALHSSVLIRDSQKRIPYELANSFSLEEFREKGATYAVSNLDWATIDFYWWMTAGLKDYRYFNKPVRILEETYPALALREISDYSIFNVVNPWEAPDSNFIGAVVPDYEVTNKVLVKNFDFKNNEEGWSKTGDLGQESGKLFWSSDNGGSLKISKEGNGSKILRWESPAINVTRGDGYIVNAELFTDSNVNSNTRDGFIRVDMFSKGERIRTRLSSRLSQPSQEKDLVIKVPEDIDTIKVGFQVYDMNSGNYFLNKLSIFGANVVETVRQKTESYHIPVDILFPNSHGGL